MEISMPKVLQIDIFELFTIYEYFAEVVFQYVLDAGMSLPSPLSTFLVTSGGCKG